MRSKAAISIILFVLKAFYSIESSHKLIFFSARRLVLLDACATCLEVPSNISIIIQGIHLHLVEPLHGNNFRYILTEKIISFHGTYIRW